MDFPDGLKYTKEHEWVQVKGDVAMVGITDYAQDSLGDIVFMELPNVGDTVSAGDSIAVVESVKSVSDIYTPVSGKIVEVNENAEAEPELLNQSPYKKGWIFKVKTTDSLDDLMDSADYEEYVGQ